MGELSDGAHLRWEEDTAALANHYRAETLFGAYHIGPRSSDGAWEYCTPDEDWGEHNQHILDNLSRDQAFAAAEADFAARSSGLS